MRYRQRGVTMVEFALVGGLFLALLFGIIEMGRMLWIWNTLNEATRRGARYAAISCPSVAKVTDVTLFAAPGSGATQSPMIKGLLRSNVTVTYTPTTNPTTITVGITGFSPTFFIPGISSMTPHAFSTTLPVESLGTGGGQPACP